MSGFFDKLRQGLGLVGDAVRGAVPGSREAKIAAHFKQLGEVDRALPARVARFVMEGDASSVVATLQGQPARECWRMRGRSYPPQDDAGVFATVADWRIDQMQRMGEALTALEPLHHDWGMFGTKKSPDWLRHVVTLWLGHGRKAQPVDTLVELAEQEGEGVPIALDIVFCRDAASYGSSNSVDRFAGVDAWLVRAAGPVTAAFPGLGADVRAELASAIGRFGLHAAYLDLLLDTATGSSKKARTTARQALTGADRADLAAALRRHFAAAPPARRAELVEVAVGTLPDGAAALLADWREGESAPKVLAALDQTAATLRPSPGPAADGPRGEQPADDATGYAAIDGTRVTLPEMPPLPEATPVPADLLRVLEPATEAFNRLLAAGQAEAVDAGRWHWSKQFSRKDGRDIRNLARLAEGTEPVELHGKQTKVVDWLRFPQFKDPAVEAFLRDPRLTLHHLSRIAVAMTNGNFHALLGDWTGPIGVVVQQRLAQGDDVRAFFTLWARAGGSDPVSGHLTQRWYAPLPDFDVPLWPVIASRLGDLDEALGLVPQSAAQPMRPASALELLELLPKVPERYRGRLMLLAGDSSAKLRDGARSLLQGAPDLGGAIALQLQDGRQETRALAADWLAARGERAQAPAIRKALAKERSEFAKAAMITALERMGEDVSDWFDPATLLKEATAGLAKARPKGLDWLAMDHFPPLTWRDGGPVDPLLPRWWAVLTAKLKQPGGNALMNLWLDRLAPGDAHRLGWMVLTGWIDEDTRTPTEEEANAYAAKNVDATLQQHIALVKKYPQSADYWTTDRTVLFGRLKQQMAGTYLGSAADSKGVLALATRVNGADAAHRIRAFLKDHGSRVSQAKALLDLLAAIGSGPALQAVLAAANRSKQRSLQAHAATLVEQIAERNGWSAGQLADRTVPTGGFDADGTQDLECGENRSYRLQLDAQDAVVILNADGREVKALPGPRVDEEKPVVDAAKKQLSNARKEVKQVLAAQAERLQEAMYLQRAWERGEWETFVAGHPIVGRIAARLVWQGVDEEGRAGATFRPLGDGSHTDAHDGDVTLADFAQIRLAHSTVLEAGAIAAWRTHLADYDIAPPFDQLGRDLPQLADDQQRARSIIDREGWMIESFRLRGVATKLGYQRGPAQDGGWFLTYEKTFREAGLLAEIEFTGSPLPEENRPTALQSLGFRKLRAGGGGGGGQIALGEVPPVLLAECWRDLHDIAEKGSGFDADWKNKAYV